MYPEKKAGTILFFGSSSLVHTSLVHAGFDTGKVWRDEVELKLYLEEQSQKAS